MICAPMTPDRHQQSTHRFAGAMLFVFCLLRAATGPILAEEPDVANVAGWSQWRGSDAGGRWNLATVPDSLSTTHSNRSGNSRLEPDIRVSRLLEDLSSPWIAPRNRRSTKGSCALPNRMESQLGHTLTRQHTAIWIMARDLEQHRPFMKVESTRSRSLGIEMPRIFDGNSPLEQTDGRRREGHIADVGFRRLTSHIREFGHHPCRRATQRMCFRIQPVDGRGSLASGTDPAGYCTPILINHRGEKLLIVWTPEHVIGMRPKDGTALWSFPTK